MDNYNNNYYNDGQHLDNHGPRTSSSHTDNNEFMLASSIPKRRAGRIKFNETRHPVYRGVRQRNGNRWVCEIRPPNSQTRIWLGTYRTAEMAARAHDVAALALRGRAACLNFADSAWRFRIPDSSDTEDIQRAAAEAAEACRGEEQSQSQQVINNVAGESSSSINNSYNDGQMEAGEENRHENTEYIDEEAVFNMPGLLTSMAEEMLLPPPYGGGFHGNDDDPDSDYCQVSLWNFSA